MTELPPAQMTLADGRTLSYLDTGTGEAGTWIHCHGIPGSRNELAHLIADLIRQGYRLIIPDRPGYGGSTPHPNYRFASHAEDLQQLADQLDLYHFTLSGFSGGGVFALTAAHDLGTRISRLAIAATPAVPLMQNPFGHASELTANAWRAALDNPGALATDLETLTCDPGAMADAMISAGGVDEARFWQSDHRASAFAANLTTALAQGTTTAAQTLARDSALMAGDWGINPEAITQPVDIIHGRDDRLVHLEHQGALLTWLPKARKVTVAHTGHYGVVSTLWASRD